MAAATQSDIVRFLEAGEGLPPDVLAEIAHHHRSRRNEEAKKQIEFFSREIKGRPRPSDRFGIGRRPAPLPVPFDIPVLACPAQESRRIANVRADEGFIYGSDEAPRLGSLLLPPKVTATGIPLHTFSAQTVRDRGLMSLAVGASNVQYPPDETYWSGIKGTSVGCGLGQLFYIPKIDQRTVSVDAIARLVSSDMVPDHVRDATLLGSQFTDVPDGLFTVEAAYGHISITLSQGLGPIFNLPDTHKTSVAYFLQREKIGNDVETDISLLDDQGFCDVSVNLKWDGSPIFFVHAKVVITATVFSSDPNKYSPSSGIDLRKAEVAADDILQVWEDRAPYSCALKLDELKLCASDLF